MSRIPAGSAMPVPWLSSVPSAPAVEQRPLAPSQVLTGRETILVTGAAGFIGSRLAQRLLDRGHRVVGVDAFTDYYDRAIKWANVRELRKRSHFRLVEADLADLDLAAWLPQVDAVCHLAGQPGVRASWGAGFDAYVCHNLLASQRLLEALATCPVRSVFASTSSVYGDAGTGEPVSEIAQLQPVSPYGLTKASMEHLVAVYRRDRGVPVVLLRYFTVFGPRQRPDMAFHRFIDAALAGRPIRVFGTGEQSRDFTYVDDVVDATIRAIGAPSPVYNVGGGTPCTVNDVLALLGELLDRDIKVARDPVARGDVLHTWADTSLARAELGWRPRTSLRDGLALQLAAHGTQRFDEPAAV